MTVPGVIVPSTSISKTSICFALFRTLAEIFFPVLSNLAPFYVDGADTKGARDGPRPLHCWLRAQPKVAVLPKSARGPTDRADALRRELRRIHPLLRWMLFCASPLYSGLRWPVRAGRWFADFWSC